MFSSMAGISAWICSRMLTIAPIATIAGGTMPAVLNAANEVAVRAFLDGKIRLSDIAVVNESVMDEHETAAIDSLVTVLAADGWARRRAIMRVESQAVSA